MTAARPILDRAHLAAATMGDSALAAELLALFAGELARLGPALLDGRDPAEAADAAHGLRGAAAAIGAFALADLAGEIEVAFRAGHEAAQAQSLLPETLAATAAAVRPGPLAKPGGVA